MNDTTNYMRIFNLAILLLILIAVAQFVLEFNATSLQDDAFMFVRYADSILKEGSPRFNRYDAATYGLTSPAFLAFVVPLRAVFRNNPVLTMLCASSLFAILFLVLISLLVKSYINGESPCLKRFVIVVLLLTFSIDSGDLTVHFTSGMDTMQALTFLTSYILLANKCWKTGSSPLVIITGLWGGFAFSVRPDLLVFTIAIPLAVIFSSSNSKHRKMAKAVLAISTLIVAIQVLTYWKLLGSPLPLSCYVKSIRHFGLHFQSVYRFYSIKEFLKFIVYLPFLFFGIALAFAIDFKGYWKHLCAIERGLVIASAAFSIYHLFCITPVMGYSQRFFYPLLPVLVVLFVQSIKFAETKLHKTVKKWSSDSLKRFALVTASIVLLLCSAWSKTNTLFLSCKEEYNGFDITEEYLARWTGYWFRLDEFSKLPDDLIIAATEVGHPLAMNPLKTVIDMTGLNETQIAHSGFSAETFFLNYRPDLIYMPHPDYREIIEDIRANKTFIDEYEVYSASELSAAMAVAINTNSRHYQRMKLIIESNIRLNQFL